VIQVQIEDNMQFAQEGNCREPACLSSGYLQTTMKTARRGIGQHSTHCHPTWLAAATALRVAGLRAVASWSTRTSVEAERCCSCCAKRRACARCRRAAGAQRPDRRQERKGQTGGE